MSAAERIARAAYAAEEALSPSCGARPIGMAWELLPEALRRLRVLTVEQLLEDGVIAPPANEYDWPGAEDAAANGQEPGPDVADYAARRSAERRAEKLGQAQALMEGEKGDQG